MYQCGFAIEVSLEKKFGGNINEFMPLGYVWFACEIEKCW